MVKQGKTTSPSVAPGQFPFTSESGQLIYTVSDLSGDIYILAHAVVEWCPEESD
jgi:hypothetical protein